MNTNFATFLRKQGAVLSDDKVISFPAQQGELKLHPLLNYSLINVSGDDAASFLQNLFSNDIKQVSAQQARHNSLNTAKGRMLFNMLIWQNSAGEYLLHIPNSMCETLLKRLRMYILRSKVTLTNISQDYITLGVTGSASVLNSLYSLPENTLSINESNNTQIIQLENQRWLICLSNEQLPQAWQQLSQLATPSNSNSWDYASIQAGIPVLLPETQEQFVPQMLNFDLINGISFKKGCYPGQEIVARTQHLGKIKRRTYLAHINSTLAPKENDPLYCINTPTEVSGHILNCAAAPEGGYQVLAVINSEAQQNETIYWAENTQTLNFQPLPYEIS